MIKIQLVSFRGLAGGLFLFEINPGVSKFGWVFLIRPELPSFFLHVTYGIRFQQVTVQRWGRKAFN